MHGCLYAHLHRFKIVDSPACNGFLPVVEGSARGNYGLTDQIAVLHWLQENIAEFGGDPQNVTLFGQGHGAAMINFLVLSPMSKVNEYTDWTKAIQHDTNILDGTMDALGDALVVAPIVRTANYHSVSPRKSYFYVFNYQLEDSKYNQRQGCVSGEDLQFVFGAPLIGTLGHFSKNYSQTEVVISEAVMTYFVNFARNGDPNSPQSNTTRSKSKGRDPNSQQSEKPQDKTKARFEKVIWPVYDKTHQNFLMLGAKPKVRDHYHAHRLSFWLNLFPKLHATSSVNASPEHHLLDDHYNPQSYDGEVRKMPYDLSKSLADAATHAPPGQQTTETSKVSGHLLNILLSTIHPDYQVTTENITLHEASNITEYKDGSQYESNYSKYSAAIGISIAGGISLLLLNVLVFSGIYYQRDRNRSELMIHKRIVMQQAMERQLSGKLDQIPPPPPAPACQTVSEQQVEEQQDEQELTLPPPHPRNVYPHRVPPKPTVIPTPPVIPQRESLAEVHTLKSNKGARAMANNSPNQKILKNTQDHQHNPNEVAC
ncbi:neuroligin-4, X-linked [Caerostris darwini]|uniref:Neuroligin-4, X-linked n=1 Tax=Caerostris darwini TaxID=1538125 RepID=A0AAV4MHV2_9ARAC|nr:neuroligin-4, X-linked [Caerostris darwini]